MSTSTKNGGPFLGGNYVMSHTPNPMAVPMRATEDMSLMRWVEDKVPCLTSFLFLCVLDVVVMAVYIKKGFSGHLMRWCGAKIAVHTAAGLALLSMRIVGLTLPLPVDVGVDGIPGVATWSDVVRLCEVVLGVAVVVAGTSSLALARHTQGHKGCCWSGCSLYTLL